MDIRKQLADFYETIAEDARIGVTHIGLYIALFHESLSLPPGEAIVINRQVLMQHSRISRRTYQKCMKQLQQYGYILYEPSRNPAKGSRVCLRKL